MENIEIQFILLIRFQNVCVCVCVSWEKYEKSHLNQFFSKQQFMNNEKNICKETILIFIL